MVRSKSKTTLMLGSVFGLLLLVNGCEQQDKQQTTETTSPVATVSTTSLNNEKGAKETSAKRLGQLYQRSTQTLFKSRALSATLYGMSEESVGIYYADKMEDYSPKQEKMLRKALFALSEQIKSNTATDLTESEQLTRNIMGDLTRYFAGDPNFDIGYIDVWMGLSPFIVNQINGPLIDVPRYMQSDQAVNNEKDALDYIARLQQYDQFVSGIQQKLKADVQKGWIAPRINLDGAVKYFDSFTAPLPVDHPLVKSLQKKLEKVSDIAPERKQELIADAVVNVEQVVYPAYQKIKQQTLSILDKAPAESGIWAQPNGEKFYQDAIKQLGDSDLTAEEIHQIGLGEVKRISAEMNRLLVAQGYTEGSVGERMASLNEEARFLYPDSTEGREALLADLNSYIALINDKMKGLFKTAPPYQVEVRAFPKDIEEGAAGGQYTPPSLDGSKPGIYWINLRDMKANPKFALKSLTFHEANPGHHWQVALNMAQTQMPFLQRIAPFNAYIEGWALYAEQVAQELGIYLDDPFGDLGRLQAELFRAVRLVVDTGLHQKRWSREQAIDYMFKTTGSAKSDVVAEIDRYMVWPGQALGYKLGMLKILELRAKAKKLLGEKFDLAAFHDLVLLGGAIPMRYLEANVDSWIKQQLDNSPEKY